MLLALDIKVCFLLLNSENWIVLVIRPVLELRVYSYIKVTMLKSRTGLSGSQPGFRLVFAGSYNCRFEESGSAGYA